MLARLDCLRSTHLVSYSKHMESESNRWNILHQLKTQTRSITSSSSNTIFEEPLTAYIGKFEIFIISYNLLNLTVIYIINDYDENYS